MLKGFSQSYKRATVVFNNPDFGCSVVQENAGVVSVKMRAAIDAAREAFFKIYIGDDDAAPSGQEVSRER